MSNARSRRARQAEQRAVEAKRRRERKIVTMVALGLAVLLVVGGVIWLVVQNNLTKTGAGPAQITEVQQTPVNGTPIRFGSETAGKTMELFIDFHCSHCVDFEERVGTLIAQAEAQEAVRIDVYPMTIIDQGSVNAANAFACSAEAGFPRAYFNGLFANPTRAWETDQLITLASEVGHSSSPEFESCVTNGTYLGWVESIGQTATAKQVKGTPSIFVDGTVVSPSITDEALRELLGV